MRYRISFPLAAGIRSEGAPSGCSAARSASRCDARALPPWGMANVAPSGRALEIRWSVRRSESGSEFPRRYGGVPTGARRSDSTTIRAPDLDTRRTTTRRARPIRRRQVEATSHPERTPDFRTSTRDGSWWVVQKPADLPLDNFASVHSKLRPLHANDRRTCHPSVSHLAVTAAASPVACPSLVVEAANTQHHRAGTTRCTHARRTRGWIR
jgi:hypothetical protein